MDFITVITAILSIHLITQNVVVNSHSTKEPAKPDAIVFGSYINSTKIDEVENDVMIPPEIFAREYLIKGKPLVLRETAKEWPAFKQWTDVELKYKYGHVEVRIDGVKGKMSDKSPRGDICTGRDTLAFFVHSYQMTDVNKFIDSELPTPLYGDVKLPPPLGCGSLSQSVVEVDLWMSSGGVRSLLRKNALDTFTCVLDGTQEWKIVGQEYDRYMYEIWRGDLHEKSNIAYSLVDPENVDIDKYPRIQKVPKISSTHLHAGDCLFIPAGTWHTVLAMGERNLAVSFITQKLEDAAKLNLGKCAMMAKALPLTEVDPQWQYPGNGRMSKGNPPFSYFLEIMDSFFGVKEKKLRHDMLLKTLQFVMSHLPYSELHVEDRAQALYDHLITIADGKDFMVDMLQELTPKQLRLLINEYIQPPVAANNCNLDHTYFSPDTVAELFENISKANKGIVTKEKFVAAYVNIDGHTQAALDVWDIVGDEDEPDIEYNGNEHKIAEAVSKFALFWRETEEPHAVYDDDDDDEPTKPDAEEKPESRKKEEKKETPEEPEPVAESKSEKDEL